MASEENIKVAVRLRPFIPSIKDEAEGKVKRIIRMDELASTVSITNPDNRLDIQKFTFDSILWSFDGYSEQADGYLAPENKAVSEEIYCDQKQVYDEVGKEAVQNLWNGYNSTIFTFGERKSGKSWTVFGVGVNKGIVPQALTDIFKGVRDKEKTLQQNGSTIEVRISMAEIYNDKVKDLLPAPPLSPSSSSSSTKFKSSLKLREHSKKGFYIEGLRTVIAVNNEDIQQRLEEGLVNRAVFLTNVNGTAGNSMTIVCITLVQKIRNHRGDEVTRTATLEFIDLPSCEFKCSIDARSTNVNAEDYVEGGCAMNSPILRSNGIDCLVNCVTSCLEASIGKHNDIIPFHSHTLTKLMRNAMVGNSKTFVVVTLNPSEQAYRRSLFVLKFAERVRMLSTRAVINEEVTSKLIRELKGENEKLRKLISLGDFDTNEFTSRLDALDMMGSPTSRDSMKRRITDEMKGQIRENDKEIRNLQQPLDERLKPFKTEKNDVGKKIDNDRKSKCHVFNLNSDAQITGKIIFIIPPGTIDFGSMTNGKGKESNHFITFFGPGIQDHHGTFSYNSKDGKFSIKPSGPNCKILVNEIPIQFDTILGTNDRIILGGNQVWIFQNPKEVWLEKYAFPIKFHMEDIMEETAMKSDSFRRLNSIEHLHDSLKKQLLSLLPSLEDAKTLAEDLNQNFKLHPVLQHPVASLIDNASIPSDEKNTSYSNMITEVDEENYSDSSEGKSPTILVKVQNLVDGTFCYWSVAKFHDRLELLKGSYMQYLEDGDIPLKEVEAFKERTDLDVPIGYSIICLKPLGYLMNLENSSVPILDYISYQSIGTVEVSLCLYDDNGEKLNDLEVFVESPDELLDQGVDLLLSIQNLQNVTYQFKEIYCKYKFLDEDEEVTKYLDSRTSSFITGSGNKYERRISLGPVTDNILNLILTQCLVLRFFGKQRSHKLLNLVENGHSNGPNQYDRGKSSNPVEMEFTMAQLKVKEKMEQRHYRRLNAFKTLMEQSEALGEDSIPIDVMKTLFDAKSQNLVNQSLEEHKDFLTPLPEEEPEEKQLPPELKALKRFSEICSIT